jgi:radical SAM superfamily enzyme YgiQ (UPF0313 family)
MKKFLFVSLPRHDLSPSAAIGALNGVALNFNCETEIIDFASIIKYNLSDQEFEDLDNWSMFIQEDISNTLAQKICSLWSETVERKQKNFDYICISVFTYWSLNIARLLLEYHNRIPRITQIIVGGCGCSSEFPDTRIRFNTWCKDLVDDICLEQDGEQYIADIINAQVDYNNDISLYPIPNYSGFDFNNYDTNKIYITGSKGCVRNCTFCDVAALWPKFRYRKATNLVQEIKEQFYNYGTTIFDFTDSLINGSLSNFYKFNCLLAEEKEKDKSLKDIRYTGQAICRPRRQMPPSHYEAMYYGGCDQVTIGIESFSQDVRYHMKKKFSNEDIDYHIEQCSYYDISNIWLMIVGYPTETIKNHEDNLKALDRYVKYAKNGTLELIHWGYTMIFLEDTPISTLKYMKELEIYNDDTLIPQGNLGGFYTWGSHLNPTNTLQERIRRRVELHEKSIELGYSQPRVKQELNSLLRIAKQISK